MIQVNLGSKKANDWISLVLEVCNLNKNNFKLNYISLQDKEIALDDKEKCEDLLKEVWFY